MKAKRTKNSQLLRDIARNNVRRVTEHALGAVCAGEDAVSLLRLGGVARLECDLLLNEARAAAGRLLRFAERALGAAKGGES